MHCRYCAEHITDDSSYCPQCGRSVEAAEVRNGSVSPASRHHPATQIALEVAGLSEAKDRSGRALTPDALAVGDADSLTDEGDNAQKRLDSKAVHGLLAQANLLRMRGQSSEAIDNCVEVLRVQPSNQTAHSLLGDIYRDQGRLDDAIQWYRMAVDLRPNVSDEAKLARAERERQKLIDDEESRMRQGYGHAASPSALAVDAELNAGTTNLIGVSPRRWLRAITIIALAFFVLGIIALIKVTPNRHGATSRSVSGFGAGVGALPPVHLPDGTQSGQAPVLSGSAAAGVGVKPDSSAGGLTATRPAQSLQSAPASQSLPVLPPAPVTGVQPLGTESAMNAPRDTPPPVDANSLQVVALTNGMHIEQTQNVGDGSAAVLVSAPDQYAGDTSDAAREALVRNTFRAARNAFASSASYIRATVFIQVQSPQSDGEVAIMEATLDRTAALTARPESDSIDSLIGRISALKWPGASPTPQKNQTSDTTQPSSSSADN